ncbi:MAG: hypothetical protein EOO02_13650 [Chitinophagaceae bacterium]|nr:MAG: hypothetical protein EOO02_13650 [Chitinophagaceae bacterium]
MSETSKKPKKHSKKEILRKHIEASIANSLPDLKQTIGDKKFEKKIKKASKLLVAGVQKKIRSNKKKAEAQTPLVAVTNP